MAKIITIANRKGGVGKTTTAVNLGAVLLEKGYKVLFIDLDKQADTSKNLGADLLAKGSYEMLANKLDAIDVTQVINDKYNIISASKDLQEIPIKLSGDIDNEYILNDSLEEIKKHFDFIIIDTPPNIDIIIYNALTCSDYVVVTSLASVFSLDGCKSLFEAITKTKKRKNTSLTIGGILITNFNKQTIIANDIKDTLEEIAITYDTKVYKTYIRKNTALEEAQALNLPITEYKKDSNGFKDYEAFANEVIADLEK